MKKVGTNYFLDSSIPYVKGPTNPARTCKTLANPLSPFTNVIWHGSLSDEAYSGLCQINN